LTRGIDASLSVVAVIDYRASLRSARNTVQIELEGERAYCALNPSRAKARGEEERSEEDE